MKRKVYVPHLPTRFDAATRRHVPTIDINPAAQYGELVLIDQGPIESAEFPGLVSRATQAGRDSASADLALCVGDIVLTAAFIIGAWERHGSVTLLRWDRKQRAYNMVKVDCE